MSLHITVLMYTTSSSILSHFSQKNCSPTLHFLTLQQYAERKQHLSNHCMKEFKPLPRETGYWRQRI